MIVKTVSSNTECAERSGVTKLSSEVKVNKFNFICQISKYLLRFYDCDVWTRMFMFENKRNFKMYFNYLINRVYICFSNKHAKLFSLLQVKKGACDSRD